MDSNAREYPLKQPIEPLCLRQEPVIGRGETLVLALAVLAYALGFQGCPTACRIAATLALAWFVLSVRGARLRERLVLKEAVMDDQGVLLRWWDGSSRRFPWTLLEQAHCARVRPADPLVVEGWSLAELHDGWVLIDGVQRVVDPQGSAAIDARPLPPPEVAPWLHGDGALRYGLPGMTPWPWLRLVWCLVLGLPLLLITRLLGCTLLCSLVIAGIGLALILRSSMFLRPFSTGVASMMRLDRDGIHACRGERWYHCGWQGLRRVERLPVGPPSAPPKEPPSGAAAPVEQAGSLTFWRIRTIVGDFTVADRLPNGSAVVKTLQEVLDHLYAESASQQPLPN